MKTLGKYLATAGVTAVIGAAAIVASSAPASAAVACNNRGECWHVRGEYAYRPEFGIVVHPDGWRWGRREHFRWHEHEGRGYWRDGVWIQF